MSPNGGIYSLWILANHLNRREWLRMIKVIIYSGDTHIPTIVHTENCAKYAVFIRNKNERPCGSFPLYHYHIKIVRISVGLSISRLFFQHIFSIPQNVHFNHKCIMMNMTDQCTVHQPVVCNVISGFHFDVWSLCYLRIMHKQVLKSVDSFEIHCITHQYPIFNSSLPLYHCQSQAVDE